MTFDESECPDGTDWDVLHERLQARVRFVVNVARECEKRVGELRKEKIGLVLWARYEVEIWGFLRTEFPVFTMLMNSYGSYRQRTPAPPNFMKCVLLRVLCH